GGATILSDDAFKPRTSPYSFQGHGETALKWMRECGDELGMPICTEVMDTRQVELIERYADAFQIGARNMQNFDLLREVGKTRKPVLLKRGLAASAKSRRSRIRSGIHWTCRAFPSRRSGHTCRSSWTRVTQPGSAITSARSP